VCKASVRSRAAAALDDRAGGPRGHSLNPCLRRLARQACLPQRSSSCSRNIAGSAILNLFDIKADHFGDSTGRIANI
jgi:hypothetical protein